MRHIDIEEAASMDRRRRWETNCRSQVGKIIKAELANVGEPERQVRDTAREGELPQTDTDAP